MMIVSGVTSHFVRSWFQANVSYDHYPLPWFNLCWGRWGDRYLVFTSDDAHDLFTRTFNPVFVQKIASVSSEHRTEAWRIALSRSVILVCAWLN